MMPLIVGMGLVDKKISRLKHFDDRLFKKLKFEHFNQEDIEKILNELTDLEFSEEALKYIATRTNQFRKLDSVEKVKYFLIFSWGKMYIYLSHFLHYKFNVNKNV